MATRVQRSIMCTVVVPGRIRTLDRYHHITATYLSFLKKII